MSEQHSEACVSVSIDCTRLWENVFQFIPSWSESVQYLRNVFATKHFFANGRVFFIFHCSGVARLDGESFTLSSLGMLTARIEWNEEKVILNIGAANAMLVYFLRNSRGKTITFIKSHNKVCVWLRVANITHPFSASFFCYVSRQLLSMLKRVRCHAEVVFPANASTGMSQPNKSCRTSVSARSLLEFLITKSFFFGAFCSLV